MNSVLVGLVVVAGCSSGSSTVAVCGTGHRVEGPNELIACVDVLERSRVRDCVYEDGRQMSIWNARVRLRAIEASTGREVARTTRTLHHDTSNRVSGGCPMVFDAAPLRELPDHRRELRELFAQQTSGTFDHLVGVSTGQAHP